MKLLAFLVLSLSICGVFRYERAATESSLLHTVRSSKQDLEIGGDVPGFRSGFVRYEDLLALPQVSIVASNDINFADGVKLSGVYLDTLAQALGIAGGDEKLMSAMCDDKYEAHYPVEYRRAHRPILVLKINGQPPNEWAHGYSGHKGYDGYAPYLISHASFTPSFHVLSHLDEAQVPYGVTELKFRRQAEALASISPRGSFAADAPQVSGFKIAVQNCLRCHNQGPLGGLKAGCSWQELADIAAQKPQYFSDYIARPRSENPAAKMPSYAKYDVETLRALTAYFQTFAVGAK